MIYVEMDVFTGENWPGGGPRWATLMEIWNIRFGCKSTPM